MRPRSIYLIAGEPSGDLLGARLIQCLRRLHPLCPQGGEIRIQGIGGPQMEAEGLKSLFPMSDLTLMGAIEVIPHLPHLWRRLKQTIEAIRIEKPDVVVTIDAPDFCLRVAKALKKIPFSERPKIVHYVAPSVWAWRPGRAAKIAKDVDHLLALFDFEPPYFTVHQLPCTFVGHPLIENIFQPLGALPSLYDRLPLKADRPLLCLLPGSRPGEINRLLPIFIEVIRQVRQQIPLLQVVLPTLPPVQGLVESMVKDQNIFVLRGAGEKQEIFQTADVALAASGTVALELGLAGLPTVIAYRLGWLTGLIARLLVKTPYASLPNIILKKEVIPEFIQNKCTVASLTAAVLQMFQDKGYRENIHKELATLRSHLAMAGTSPSERAAEVILSLMPPS